MLKKVALFAAGISLLSFCIINNFSQLVIEKLETYSKDYPEKIYVKTDKPYYIIGEDIWYSAYLVNGINHKASNKSNVIYVELVNDQDSIVSRKKLYTNDISAAGDFKINNKWKAGTYILRAYTNYMRNRSSDFFFKKEIPIWGLKEFTQQTAIDSIPKTAPIKKESMAKRPDLKFYPEGGYLVNGLQSKVGIKIKDKKNRTRKIEGVIKDQGNNTITTFKNFEFGLGLFMFTPEPNNSYYASIQINGKEEKYELPKPLPLGFNLNLLNNGSEVIIKVSSNKNIGLKHSFLVAHQRGKIIYQKFETTATNSYAIKLNTSELNSGVMSVSLFNNEGKPECERLVFIDNPNKNININLDTTAKTPNTKEKITLLLDLKDKNGNPVSGNLSLTVNDLDLVDKHSSNENIKTYLLLNSDLRGHIENPGYFFEKENDPKRRFLLDLVMFTHGWSRFTWNELLYQPKPKQNYAIENGIIISGQTFALKQKGKRISAATKLTLMGSIPHQETAQSNANGQFNFGPFVFYDSISTLVEARVKAFKSPYNKNRDVEIFLNNAIYPSPQVTGSNIIKPNSFNNSIVTNFVEQSKKISNYNLQFLNETQRLEEVTIIAKKRSEAEKREEALNERADNNSPTHRMDMNDVLNSEAFTIFNLLNRLPGVRAFNDSISIRNGGQPKILLDGMEVEVSDITFLRGSEVEFIDILTGTSAAMVSNSGNGVVAIYTKLGNGNLLNVKRKPDIIDFYYPGFYTAREFYSPNHADSFNDFSKQDTRTTLFWQPKIVITKNSKAEVSFFTSEVKTKYAIEIEGLTTEGVPVYNFSTFEVD
ncbi:TonB-dependent receptor [Pseudotamlana agarivorans]|uniref:TonB-dependent receptor n=1 Tax=Pseudotamlana agarivorans TaxID=481183 RepID=UPI001C0A6711|nr:Plug domain-containing protein [Tamlana agarivorans]